MSNRHWTDEEMEEAYRYWAWESEDSFKHTSEYLAIPERTLRNWAHRDKWRERKKVEQADLAEPAVGEAKVELKLGLSAVVRQLLADATNTKASQAERLQSQKLLFALTFGENYDMKQGNSFISLTEARHIHLPASTPEDIDVNDLRRQASRAIEANVSMADPGSPKRNGPVRW